MSNEEAISYFESLKLRFTEGLEKNKTIGAGSIFDIPWMQ